MIYLRYKNSPGDPWTVIPDVTSIFPAQPTGSLPLAHTKMETAAEVVSPCGCSGDATDDDHYILKAEIKPMAQSAAPEILMYLLNFKSSNYHEVKYARYADGDFLSAKLSLIKCEEQNGMSTLSFRLAAPIVDVI